MDLVFGKKGIWLIWGTYRVPKFEAAGLIPKKTMIKQLFRANVKYGGV